MPGAEQKATTSRERTTLDARLAEESLTLHLRYGGEYMDLNPITGQPGSFHLSSTGRKDNKNILSVAATANDEPLTLKDAGLPQLDTKAAAADNPLSKGKETKSPRTGAPKPKRRKSKGGTATPTTSTPNTPR
jgi:mediator of RNA polymerase II transcription subunit 6